MTLTNFLSSQSLFAFPPTHLDKYFFQDLLLIMQKIPCMPYASFYSTSVADDLSILNIEDPMPSWAEELQRIRQAHYDPSEKDTQDGSLAKYSLLSVVDDFSYTGSEFEFRRVCVPTTMVEYMLGRETFAIEIQQYPQAYMSTLKEGASPPSLTDQSALPGIPDPTLRMDNRMDYEDVSPLTLSQMLHAPHIPLVFKTKTCPKCGRKLLHTSRWMLCHCTARTPENENHSLGRQRTFFFMTTTVCGRLSPKGRFLIWLLLTLTTTWP